MRVSSGALFALVGMCAVVFGAVPALAQQQAPPQEEGVQAAPPEKPETAVAPEAEKVLRQMAEYFKKLETVQLTSEWKQQVKTPEVDQTAESVHSIYIERPNKLAVVHESGEELPQIVSDGETLALYVPARQMYSTQEAPETVAALVKSDEVQPFAQSLLFIAPLLEQDPYEAFTTGPSSIDYVGKETLGEVDTHHLRLVTGPSGWDIWIKTGDSPVPVKAAPDLSAQLEQIKGQNPDADVTLEVALSFSNWKPGAAIDAERFAFTPPDNAEKVESLFAALNQPPEDEDALEVGAKAEPFTLDLLDGGQVELAKHVGKNIVILDFWATWCGPCRMAMPIIDRVADQYADQNVVLYAVNLRESPEQIKSFLEDNGLDLSVALDTDGEVGNLYNARSIPQTVIIGADGTIQAVHVGFSPELENELKAELDKLVKGENIAG